ncbi:hypothetical protein [Herbiconiux sp. UC225_62]
MTIALLFFGILALLGIAATVVGVVRDGYRPTPRREALDFDPESHFLAH